MSVRRCQELFTGSFIDAEKIVVAHEAPPITTYTSAVSMSLSI